MTKKVLALTLFILAFIERVFFDLGPNTELVTFAMILSAAYLGRRESLGLTFLIIAVTDLVIGNTNIFIFTWSGFLIPAFLSGTIFGTFKVRGIKKVGLGTISAIGANLFFFFWTNFGVWLVGPMYPKTLGGLATSYINGLPFLNMQLLSTLLFVPLGFFLFEAAFLLKKSSNFGKFALSFK